MTAAVEKRQRSAAIMIIAVPVLCAVIAAIAGMRVSGDVRTDSVSVPAHALYAFAPQMRGGRSMPEEDRGMMMSGVAMHVKLALGTHGVQYDYILDVQQNGLRILADARDADAASAALADVRDALNADARRYEARFNVTNLRWTVDAYAPGYAACKGLCARTGPVIVHAIGGGVLGCLLVLPWFERRAKRQMKKTPAG